MFAPNNTKDAVARMGMGDLSSKPAGDSSPSEHPWHGGAGCIEGGGEGVIGGDSGGVSGGVANMATPLLDVTIC